MCIYNYLGSSPLKRRGGPLLAVVEWLDYFFTDRPNHLPLALLGYSSFAKAESRDSYIYIYVLLFPISQLLHLSNIT
jgi:hypothetical protein